jgi:diacylglycerol kinase family enzyme
VAGALFVNPRSGNGGPSADELGEAARGLGVDVHVLDEGDDLVELAREAHADVLGMAGGDGSLGAVAGVAVERSLPFVCVPFGTRNHFARDAGLDSDDPVGSLEAFRSTEERRVDVGRVGDRVFLNNVSLGMYARLVHRRERGRRRDEAFARMRALAVSLRDHRRTERFVVGGKPARASVILVANNEYGVDLLSFGEREQLDEGALYVYVGTGLRLHWSARVAGPLEIQAPAPKVRAAVDGEPELLASPISLRIEPGALRLRLAPGRP